jgi:hypothetical protein
VGSWIEVLREDKNEIFRAAHEASSATDFVLSLDREVSRAETLEMVHSGTALMESADRRPGGASLAGTLENDSLPPERQSTSANGRMAAQYETGIGTAGVLNKEPDIQHRTAVDTLGQRAHEIDGNPKRSTPSSGDLAASFAAAKTITTNVLGESARTFPAQTQSGRYSGRIIGETAHHVVQRLSPQTAVAHMKHLLGHLPGSDASVAINYSNDHAQVRDLRERVNTQELGR